MMTAFGSADMVKGALALGASRVLNKPVDLEDLIPLVNQDADRRFANP
jgi:DNA-binding NtrC family response regulator